MIKQLIAGLFVASNLVWLIFDDITAGVDIGGFDLRVLIFLLIPLCFIPVAVAQIRRLSVHYVITDNNVWAKKRILARDVDPVVLSRAQDVNYSQSMLDRLVNKGDVRIETAGTSGTDIVLSEIPNPRRAHQLIRERIEEFDKQTSARGV